ncbi:MAG: polysaccharide deacetylase family protein, partial [Acidimicrobiales bacterium]
ADPPVQTSLDTPPLPDLPPIPPPHPGSPTVISQSPNPSSNTIALTIDDGYCASCVSAYVQFAETTGTAITFSPNGTYSAEWTPHAATLRDLIAAGQVQIGNHTYTHLSMLGRSDSDVQADIMRNEAWIQETFGITSRPYLRPPYGFHNSHSDALAASLGYTKILLWNGTLGDATPISATDLLNLANQYFNAGTIMLGHANHPTVNMLYPQLLKMLGDRNLRPVTLDTMFGTSRARG